MLIIFILSIIFFLDLSLLFYTWQSRIFIGKWQRTSLWVNKVEEITLKWLNKTPVIPLNDNKRLIIIDVLKRNYKRQSIQYWQEASLLLGLLDSYKKNQKSKIRKEIDFFVLTKLKGNGTWKKNIETVDGALLAYGILSIPWIDKKLYKPAFDMVFNFLKKMRGSDGLILYRESMKNYRYVDTIGFVVPFLMKYGKIFQSKEATDLGLKQILIFYELGFSQEYGIPAHAYSVEKKLPVGLYAWGRGLGWYILGLVATWNLLDDNHVQKSTIKNIMLLIATSVLSLQNKNGSWNWLMTDSSAQSDSSITVMCIWLLQHVSLIENSKILESSISEALFYLKGVTQRNGAVDFSQGDTKSLGIYSTSFGILPFTQGFLLRILNKANYE